MKQTTVLLAEDHHLVRRELRKILELEDDLTVVGEAKNGRQAVAMVQKLRPAVVVMDIGMPVLNGLEATCEILKAFPATKIIMHSAHSDDAYIEAAAQTGAMGYLIKPSSAGIICAAIRKVQNGIKFFSPSILKRLRQRN